LLYSRPRSLFGVFAPIYTPNGVAVFGRDQESSKQVWSAKEGYPGDTVYRDFYRDVGFDLDMGHVGPYVSPDGIRTFTGIKYHRITGETEHKELYDPDAAYARVQEHAANFVFNRERQAEHLADVMGKQPIILSPYDAELFGHWWFEGPDFLEHVLRRMAPSMVRPVTMTEYLEENPTHQVATPCASSWGDKGYYEVWLNGSNDWIWRYLHDAAIRMSERARQHQSPDPVRERVLNQMARELLLAQSSDWPFIMTMGTSVQYAERRFKLHIDRFNQLDAILHEGWDEDKLRKIEEVDNIFPDIDYRVYGK
jgi:1,4-alpha-glucan branching enzyme